MDYLSCLSYSRDGNALVRHPMENPSPVQQAGPVVVPGMTCSSPLLSKLPKPHWTPAEEVPAAVPITLDAALPLPSRPALEEQGGGEG